MPYRNRRELPKPVRDALPDQAEDIYRKAFNNALAQYNDEQRAHRVAWAAVKQQYHKGRSGKWVPNAK